MAKLEKMKESRLENIRKKKAEAELENCTFKPDIDHQLPK